MGVVRTVRRVLLKAQAHRVVGIPQVLTHAHTMTHVGNAGWPSHRHHRGFHLKRAWLHRRPGTPALPDRGRQYGMTVRSGRVLTNAQPCPASARDMRGALG